MCKNCRWRGYFNSKETGPTNEKPQGDCRKNAPVCGGTSENTYVAWPRTNEDDWCGEFEEKECKDCKKYKTCINSTHPYWKKLAEENKGCRGFKEKK
jgi:hypothetical protein